jgi:hypothetical protein
LNNTDARASDFGWGPAVLLANNVLLYVVLAWLSKCAADSLDRTLLLSVANLGLAAMLFIPKLRGESLLLNRKTTVALLGWSVAYSLTYGAFVRWPEIISVWTLIAAQACAPLAAIFVSGDHRKDPGSFFRRIVLSSPIVLLLGIAFLEWRISRQGRIDALVALILVLLFGLSQSCARVVARNSPSPMWGPPRLAFLNGVMLFIFWSVVGPARVHGNRLTLLLGAAFLSIAIFVLQATYLFALAKTPPFLAGLLLSACVPISIFGDRILRTGPPHPPLSFWLSVGFSVATGLVAWATSGPTEIGLKASAPLELESQ